MLNTISPWWPDCDERPARVDDVLSLNVAIGHGVTPLRMNEPMGQLLSTILAQGPLGRCSALRE